MLFAPALVIRRLKNLFTLGQCRLSMRATAFIGWESAAYRPDVPGVKVALRGAGVAVVPQGQKHVSERPGPPCLERGAAHEAHELAPCGRREPRGMPEPVELRVHQP